MSILFFLSLVTIILAPIIAHGQQGTTATAPHGSNSTDGGRCVDYTCQIKGPPTHDDALDNKQQTSMIKQVTVFCTPVRLPTLVWYQWCVW
jgi:hypothetical protein